MSYNPRVQVLQSYTCKVNETAIKFSFKGDIKNGRFEGPGKLRIQGDQKKSNFDSTTQSQHDGMNQKNDTCLKVLRIDPTATVIEVVGNFKNGTLHGNIQLL